MKRFLKEILCLILAAGTMACSDASAAEDLENVQKKGKLIVGITDFAPMDYKDSDGEWIGFDADLARAFAESIGAEAEFIEIDWDSKLLELNGHTIDCVWNGMTLTEDVRTAMSVSNPYCENGQVIVAQNTEIDQYPDGESLNGKGVAAEAGSAAAEILDELGIKYISAESQASALMEVAAGTSDVCVIDSLMAGAMIGEGTDYEELSAGASLNSEEYGVGFRKGSNLTAALNSWLIDAYKNGTLQAIAAEYRLEDTLLPQEAE